MARDIAQLGPDLIKRAGNLSVGIQKGAQDAVKAAAMQAKAEQLSVMRSDAGGDLTLSRVRSGKGAKIGARFDFDGTGTGSSATVRAIGPLPLLANPIRPHHIPKKAGKRIVIPGVGVRRSANHPGTHGKNTWNRGREAAEPKIRKTIVSRMDAAVKKAFLSGG